MIFGNMEINARRNDSKYYMWLLLENKSQGWRWVEQGAAICYYKIKNVLGFCFSETQYAMVLTSPNLEPNYLV